MTSINSIFRLICLAACILFFWDVKSGRCKTSALKQEKAPGKWLFYAVLAFLIGIRAYEFGAIPGGFNQDGAMAAVDALALAEHGTDRFGTWLPAHFEAWGYGQMSVLLSYLMVPFIKLFGFDPVSLRMPILIFSILGALALCAIAKQLISEKTALITLMFAAINPWHFMQSRWAVDCNLFPHMFIIGLYFLNRGIDQKKYIYLSMVFFGLCMFCYGVAFYMVPFFLLGACILLAIKKRVGWKEIAISVAIYFGISFPIYGTMIINFLDLETVRLPFVTMQRFSANVRASEILFFSEDPLWHLAENVKCLIRIPFLQRPDFYWNQITGFGTIYLCSLPLLATGLVITGYQAVKNPSENKRILFSFLLIYWVTSLLIGIIINSINLNRINIIYYAHMLFICIAVYYMIRTRKALAIVLGAVYLISGILFFKTYFGVWAWGIRQDFLEDFLEAADFAESQNADTYYITAYTQSEESNNVSEIMTVFAFQLDAEYFQGKTDDLMGKHIPYGERFHYSIPKNEVISSAPGTVYVAHHSEMHCFQKEEFEITNFGDYDVLQPKSVAGQ